MLELTTVLHQIALVLSVDSQELEVRVSPPPPITHSLILSLAFTTVNLGATSGSTNRCGQLARPPPNGTDFCAFVGDTVTLRCDASTAGVTTTIYPDGENTQKVFNSIQPDNEGSYLCNGTSECGPASDMYNIRVYGESGHCN